MLKAFQQHLAALCSCGCLLLFLLFALAYCWLFSTALLLVHVGAFVATLHSYPGPDASSVNPRKVGSSGVLQSLTFDVRSQAFVREFNENRLVDYILIMEPVVCEGPESRKNAQC